MGKNTAFIEVFVSLSSCCMLLLFIYLFSKCLASPAEGHVQCLVPRIHREKTKLLLNTCNLLFISTMVISNVSISKSDFEFFESRHCLIYLCIIRAKLGTK